MQQSEDLTCSDPAKTDQRHGIQVYSSGSNAHPDRCSHSGQEQQSANPPTPPALYLPAHSADAECDHKSH